MFTFSVPSQYVTCGVSTDIFQSNELSRIVGGSKVPRGHHTYIASIRRWNYESEEFEHICGATLFHRRFLLTAAHCFQRDDHPSNYAIILGDNDRMIYERTEQIIEVKRRNVHYAENGMNDNDIAIIELKEEAILNQFVSLACIPRKDSSFSPGRMCMVAGWGNTLSNGHRTSSRLQVASIPLIDRRLCMRRSRSHLYSILPEHSFCAGYFDGGIDTCQGDSGGPLVCQENDGVFYLVGVTSWGDGCAQVGKPGVYVNVSSYIDWIEKVLKISKLSRFFE